MGTLTPLNVPLHIEDTQFHEDKALLQAELQKTEKAKATLVGADGRGCFERGDQRIKSSGEIGINRAGLGGQNEHQFDPGRRETCM